MKSASRHDRFRRFSSRFRRNRDDRGLRAARNRQLRFEPLERREMMSGDNIFGRAVTNGGSPTPPNFAPLLGDGVPFGIGTNALPTGNELDQFNIATPDVLVTQGLHVPDPGAFWGAGDFDNSGDTSIVYAYADTILTAVNTADGTTTVIGGSAIDAGHFLTGMSTDPTDGTVYIGSTDGANSSLYTVDLSTAVVTRIGSITNSPGSIAIAHDGSGQLYGYDIITDQLLAIDEATAAGTVIGFIGFDSSFGQGMDWDADSGTMYMAAFNVGTFQAEFRSVDLATGATTFLGVIGGTVPGPTVTSQLGWVAFGGGSTSGPPRDYGDAPASYGTLDADDGARHLDMGPTLGFDRDDDPDGQPSIGADGDDNGRRDDEDGVTDFSAIVPGQAAFIEFDVDGEGGNGAFVDAFMDFNRDGDFGDAGERITPMGGLAVVDGSNTINFNVPANADVGNRYFRLRISTAGGLGPTGEAMDGEVEDYLTDDASPVIVVGPDTQQKPTVKVFDATSGNEIARFRAFGKKFLGGVRVALGDVTGDNVQDIICGAGPTGRTVVKVFDGATFQPLPGKLGSFRAFGKDENGGVNVAAGDVNNDGLADVIVAPGPGVDNSTSNTTVRVFDGATGNLISSFKPFEGPLKGGGFSVASADMNLDNVADVIVGMGPGKPGEVRAFDMTNLNAPNRFARFPVFNNNNYLGGVFVVGGDINSDGTPDYVVSKGQGPSEVVVVNGLNFSTITDFNPFPATVNGSRVALTDFDNRAGLEIVIGSGKGKASALAKVLGGPALPLIDSAYQGGPGIFVAGSANSGIQGQGPQPVQELQAESRTRDSSDRGGNSAAATAAAEDGFGDLALAVEAKGKKDSHRAAREAAFAQEEFWWAG